MGRGSTTSSASRSGSTSELGHTFGDGIDACLLGNVGFPFGTPFVQLWETRDRIVAHRRAFSFHVVDSHNRLLDKLTDAQGILGATVLTVAAYSSALYPSKITLPSCGGGADGGKCGSLKLRTRARSFGSSLSRSLSVARRIASQWLSSISAARPRRRVAKRGSSVSKTISPGVAIPNILSIASSDRGSTSPSS